MSLAREVSVVRTARDGCCTYCHRAFGSLVTWRGRPRFIEETADHVIPRAVGGRLTVPCCSLCNQIKGSNIFESLADIQNYCLDRLVRAKSIMLSEARQICLDRNVRVESVTQDEEKTLLSECILIKTVPDPEWLWTDLSIDEYITKAEEKTIQQIKEDKKNTAKMKAAEARFAAQRRYRLSGPLLGRTRGKALQEALDTFTEDSLPKP